MKPLLNSIKTEAVGYNQNFCTYKVKNPQRSFEMTKEVIKENQQFLDGQLMSKRESFTHN